MPPDYGLRPTILAPDGGDDGLAIYLHWPFCTRICPYCDFNVYRDRGVDSDEWQAAFLAQIDRLADRVGPLALRSVFFGGGTPSLMSPGLVGAILDRLTKHFPVGQRAVEVSLEANPTAAETAQFQELAAAGVNRLSLGVQSLDEADLAFLGRNHSGAEARAALDRAALAVDRLSVDLIYALPGQTPDAWQKQLEAVLGWGVDHLSAYQLTIEPGTAFDRQVAQGRWRPLPDEAAADLFMLTGSYLSAAGLPAYEVSNHARPGAESRHNLVYWTGGVYAGLGPGGHGRLPGPGGQGRLATVGHRRPQDWLSDLKNGGDGLAETTSLTDVEILEERLMMGLRLAEGRSFADLGQGLLVAEVMAGLQKRAADLRTQGWLADDPERLKLSPRGRPLINAILRQLLT